MTRLDGREKADGFEARYDDKGLNGHYGERAAGFGLGPWRVEQYRRAALKDAPSQAAPARPRGGPRRRALTQLPPKADERVRKARKQFFVVHAARKNGGATAPKDTMTAGRQAGVPSVTERQLERARRGRQQSGSDPPSCAADVPPPPTSS